MIAITKRKCGVYVVHDYSAEHPRVGLSNLDTAKNLCRIRLNKCKKHEADKEPLTIIKIPFINLWLVW